MITTFMDFETTGKLDPLHRIVEASFRRCDLEQFKELQHFESRFNPERHIEAKASSIHGIYDEDVKKEPLFKDRIPEIKGLLEATDILVAHNIPFDLPFLQQEFERAGIELPKFKTFCTIEHGTFATDLGKSPSLNELCFSLDVVYDSKLAHGASYDTEVLRDSVFNGVRFGWFSFA